MFLVPKYKQCASTHVGDMQNRIAALFVMSSAVVFVSTVISKGGLFLMRLGVDNHPERACRVFLAGAVTDVRPC